MAFRGTVFTSFSLCVSIATLLLSGCSANFSPSTTFQPEQVPIGPIQGSVHGGQAPVSGAAIYIFAASTAGYGQASSSLIGASQIAAGTALPSGVYEDSNNRGYVKTDSNGNFSLNANDYTCTEGTQVYMVAVGGDAGYGTNPYIIQMAGLGECPAAGNLAQQDPYVTINEISTVAFAYAMAPFVSSTKIDPYDIGTNNTTQGLLALHNAMANVGYLVNLGYGQPQTTMPGNANVTMPTDKLLHLANLLGMCVNTDGSLGTSTSKTNRRTGVTTYTYTLDPCGNLFNYTVGITEANGAITTGADEGQAIFNIALNPASKYVTNLYQLVTGTTAFNETMTAAPNDWTLPILYKNAVSSFASTNGSYTSGPFNIAIDASGNAWIGDRANGVIEISTRGAITNPYHNSSAMIKGVSVDSSGNIWAADYGQSKIYIMNTSGTISKTLTTGLNGPSYVAFNATGNAYAVNEAPTSITVYNSTGTSVLANSVNMNVGNGITTPAFISIDAYGNAWIPDTGGGTVGELKADYSTGYINSSSFGGSYWLGFDSSHNMWIGDFGNQRLDTGTSLGNGTYTAGRINKTGGGVTTPVLGQIDGSGTVWMPEMIVPPNNLTSASVLSAYSRTAGAYLATDTGGFSTGCSAGSCPNSGGGGLGGAVAAAVDLSGNVWVANEDGTVSELIGLGAPTAAPLTPSNAGAEP